MLTLFEEFSQKCLELQQAVRAGRDDLVRRIDSEIDPLINIILDYRAQSGEELHMQLQFLSNLIREHANNPSGVVRYTATLSMLLDRYFSNGRGVGFGGAARSPVPQSASMMLDYDYGPLGEDIVENLPDRVAVVTTDYRYLYSNVANARYLGVRPIALIGRHVREFVGESRFENHARQKFDRCFAGETLDYVYSRENDGERSSARCWMRPLRSGQKQVVSGAIVVLQDLPSLQA